VTKSSSISRGETGAISAIVFDAFGTLVEITNPKRPFRRLWELASDKNLSKEDYARAVMTSPWSLVETTQRLFPLIQAKDLSAIETDLTAELESIRLFPEVEYVLRELRSRDIKFGVCSNLASPYAEPVIRLLPIAPDSVSWSFQLGAMKPDPVIYGHACRQLGCSNRSVMMVGDKEIEDYVGPISAGMSAIRLRREGMTQVSGSIRTLQGLLDRLEAID
jgi:FMN phosphatase YigB (HAD superfamily)